MLVNKNTTNTTKGFSGEKFNLGVRLLGLDKTGGMNLDPSVFFFCEISMKFDAISYDLEEMS